MAAYWQQGQIRVGLGLDWTEVGGGQILAAVVYIESGVPIPGLTYSLQQFRSMPPTLL